MSFLNTQKKIVDINEGDKLDILPTDKNNPTHTEIEILNTLFKENSSTIEKLFTGLRDILLVGFLFLLISIPQLDGLIARFSHIAEQSIYFKLLIKTCLFMFLYFLVKNIYLVKKE